MAAGAVSLQMGKDTQRRTHHLSGNCGLQRWARCALPTLRFDSRNSQDIEFRIDGHDREGVGQFGKVDIPQAAFIAALKVDS